MKTGRSDPDKCDRVLSLDDATRFGLLGCLAYGPHVAQSVTLSVRHPALRALLSLGVVVDRLATVRRRPISRWDGAPAARAERGGGVAGGRV